MKEIFDRRYPVTSFFLLVTALVFLLMLVTTGGNFDRADTVFRFGAMYGPAIRLFPEQVWRLFSAIFVHIGWEHFIVNILSLYYLGRQVEEIFGSKKFFFLYLLSGMMGNLFVFVFSPQSLSLIHISEPTRPLYISYAVFCLIKKNTITTMALCPSNLQHPTR